MSELLLTCDRVVAVASYMQFCMQRVGPSPTYVKGTMPVPG